jgi:hypothetical protein
MDYKILHYGTDEGVPCVLFLCNDKYRLHCFFAEDEMKDSSKMVKAMNNALTGFKPFCEFLDANPLPELSDIGFPETGTI